MGITALPKVQEITTLVGHRVLPHLIGIALVCTSAPFSRQRPCRILVAFEKRSAHANTISLWTPQTAWLHPQTGVLWIQLCYLNADVRARIGVNVQAAVNIWHKALGCYSKIGFWIHQDFCSNPRRQVYIFFQ